MQNLHCKTCTRPSLEFVHQFKVYATTWDVVSNTIITALRSDEEEDVVLLTRCDISEVSGSTGGLLESRIASFECTEIVNLHYLPEKRWICLVTIVGDLIVVREEPSENEEKIEIVGSVDAGISAAEWSPDEALLVLVTKVDTVLFMTQDFECVFDYTLTPEDLKLSKHVDVGWGKEETQFKGRKARTLQDPTMPKAVDRGTLSDGDKGRATVSWRGDGAFVAINSVASGYRRVIRVLSREGILDSASEPVDGLTGSLSWRPAGNLVASIQKLKAQVKVVFFERNGLRHGEFDLRFLPQDVDSVAKHDIHLAWNIDSTVLGVELYDRVQLWTMKNYHYSLKQAVPLPHRALERARQLWHPEIPLRFVMEHDKGFIDFHFGWKVATNRILNRRDHGIVAVIDGATLGITSLGLTNMPPPMTQHQIDLAIKCPGYPPVAKDVMIDYLDDHVVHIFVLLDDDIAMYSWDLDASTSPPQLQWRCNIRRRDLAFDVANVLAGEKAQGFEADEALPQLVLPPSYIAPGKDIQNDPILAQSQQLDNFDAKAHLFSDPRPRPVAYSLTESGALIANKRVLAKSCTSFLETPAHLIYTTNQVLKFIHKKPKVEDLEVPRDDSDERSRQIERGAILITAMPSRYAIVLQMPRGNLETIYPRILVLAGIRRHIDKSNYKAAFLACRKQRIDMNVLHDHDPEKFLDLAAEFVSQLSKPEYMDLFLSSLKEEDVSRTMYLDTFPDQPSKLVTFDDQLSQGVSKVNKICNSLLKVLENIPERAQNVITAFVCKLPPDLDAALSWVAKIEDEEKIEKAVEHICFLADVNHLFDHALGLYDLQLALHIVEHSQRDPREYMPFLERLQHTEPELRRRFEIDDHLARHDKALRALYQVAAFGDVEKYVVKHKLYDQAISLTHESQEHLLAITHLHAKYLQSIAQHSKAGEAYRTIDDLSSASDCFRLAHRWQESLDCAQRAKFSVLRLDELARILAEDLMESKDYTSAAYIHEHHLHDLPSAARLHCRAYNFPEAERTVATTKDPSLYEKVLDEGLKTARSTISDLLRECTSQLHAQVPRIRELRLKKSQNPLAFLQGDSLSQETGDIPDNVSLAPTDASTAGGGGASLFTRYTGAQSGTVGTNVTRQTSKNKRREERKKARGKKGSVYEEEYLVNSVGRLVERVNSVHEDVRKIVEGLKRRAMEELGNALERQLRDVIALCKTSVPVVFEELEEQDVPDVEEFLDSGREELSAGDGGIRSVGECKLQSIGVGTEKD